MGQMLSYDKCHPASITFATEWSKSGHTLLNGPVHSGEVRDLNLKRAVICFKCELKIRENHINAPPASSMLDVSTAHYNLAKALDALASRCNENSALRAKHRGDAANHFYTAFKIRRHLLGENDPCVRETWMLFRNV